MRGAISALRRKGCGVSALAARAGRVYALAASAANLPNIASYRAGLGGKKEGEKKEGGKESNFFHGKKNLNMLENYCYGVNVGPGFKGPIKVNPSNIICVDFFLRFSIKRVKIQY